MLGSRDKKRDNGTVAMREESLATWPCSNTCFGITPTIPSRDFPTFLQCQVFPSLLYHHLWLHQFLSLEPYFIFKVILVCVNFLLEHSNEIHVCDCYRLLLFSLVLGQRKKCSLAAPDIAVH